MGIIISHSLQMRVLLENITFSLHKMIIYFTNNLHIATLSFMHLGNHQATDTKKDEFTIIVLESTNPYLPDRLEFKHQLTVC